MVEKGTGAASGSIDSQGISGARTVVSTAAGGWV
jgi:hypothetical protein